MLKAASHVAAPSVIVTTIVGWLPAVAAILPIVFYAIQIYETKTFQRILHSLLGRFFKGKTDKPKL